MIRPRFNFWFCAFVVFCPLHAQEKADVLKPQAPSLTVDNSPVNDGRGPAVVSYADVIAPVQKVVVSIRSTQIVRHRQQLVPGFPFTGESESKEEGLGSGVIVSENGYILTNNHVVEGADELNVQLPDGRDFKAKVIGTDPKTDVAVIKIEARNLPTVVVADSDKLRVGDIAFAVGNPLGVGQTVTMGIVSATRREVGLLENVSGYENFIQTDAAINQGNSGGALIDAKGRVIGINSAILSTSRGNIGIGFAIPINLAANIMRSLIATGSVERGFLGVEVDPLSSEIAETLHLPKDTIGVIVTSVTSGSPAEKAGLKPSDVITAVNHRPVSSHQELRLLVAQLSPDSEAEVTCLRDSRESVFKVKIGKLDEVSRDELLSGIHVVQLTDELRRTLGIQARIDQGLVVSEVDHESIFSALLQTNMVIVEINRIPVTDLETARQLIVPDRRNLFLVLIHNVARYISVPVPAK